LHGKHRGSGGVRTQCERLRPLRGERLPCMAARALDVAILGTGHSWITTSLRGCWYTSLFALIACG
jgi:hypothetical protein